MKEIILNKVVACDTYLVCDMLGADGCRVKSAVMWDDRCACAVSRSLPSEGAKEAGEVER